MFFEQLCGSLRDVGLKRERTFGVVLCRPNKTFGGVDM